MAWDENIRILREAVARGQEAAETVRLMTEDRVGVRPLPGGGFEAVQYGVLHRGCLEMPLRWAKAPEIGLAVRMVLGLVEVRVGDGTSTEASPPAPLPAGEGRPAVGTEGDGQGDGADATSRVPTGRPVYDDLGEGVWIAGPYDGMTVDEVARAQGYGAGNEAQD